MCFYECYVIHMSMYMFILCIDLNTSYVCESLPQVIEKMFFSITCQVDKVNVKIDTCQSKIDKGKF